MAIIIQLPSLGLVILCLIFVGIPVVVFRRQIANWFKHL